MKILVNNKEMDLPEGSTISQLLQVMQLSDAGIAIGVNNKIAPKAEWPAFILHENDNLVIIKAACGG